MGKSFSAGEYICNYTYFSSLMYKNERVARPHCVDSLFCHVPTFAEIDEPSQQKFIVDLIKEICNHVKGEKKAEKETVQEEKQQTFLN